MSRVRGANWTLGLLGVLLAGIEIGKTAASGDYGSAYTLALGAIAALVSGNVGALVGAVGGLFHGGGTPAAPSTAPDAPPASTGQESSDAPA